MTVLAPVRLSEAADSLVKASTPEPFSASKTSNWVARAGGLPPYIQHVAHDLIEKRGMPESRAIEMAVGIIKNWASGQGKVDANTRAAAQKALGEWEAKKAKNAASKAGKSASKAAGKLGESKRRVPVRVSVADRVALRQGAQARLNAIEEAFGVQVMMSLLEAKAPAFKPELKPTASASSESARFEVHDGGQHVGYVMSRPAYRRGEPERWRSAGVNGRTVGEMQDSKAAALELLRKHLTEAPARVMEMPNGKHMIAEPDGYSGPTRFSEYPSKSAARYAAGLPEEESGPEKASQVEELGEMVAFDVLTLDGLGEDLPLGLGPLHEAVGETVKDAPFKKGDRVNYQHPLFGRVGARVASVTSRHVHVSSSDPRVSPARMTHQQAASRLSMTRPAAAQEGVLDSLIGARVQEAALTAKRRNALPKDDFVYPDKAPGPGSYPIDTRNRAIAALARAADPANSGDEADVKAKVYARYPDLKPKASKAA